MPHLLVLALVAAAVFTVASAAQALTGFGSALVAVPLLALIVDPVAAVVATTAVSLVLTFVVVRKERVHVERWAVRRFAITGLVGLPVGLAALLLLSVEQLTLLMAAVLLALVVVLAVGVSLPSGPVSQRLAGVTSGALLASTGMNGPPLVLVLHAMDLAPRRFRATLQGVFCVQDLLAVAGFALIGSINVTTLALVAGGAVGIPLGWRVGNRWFHSLSPTAFRRVVLVFLAVTGVVAAVTALA